ncbi:CHAP domain-containing protein [Sinomicrobium weinanense]|uniref:CHAP domain-containing protein n=1 Tax=Sinomicrobium weinanense TaxID=2842200 RepID=A0A926JPG4_9FLAO|nr:CHAP domain-containing protein [Sinomicrobium weinanense]MBC9795065.1 CHAP domain-containing protein [Sinomicrobium weinanense]MBU3123806.1 CHAP domain-containing protein [Sinomicrobium weinanense]
MTKIRKGRILKKRRWIYVIAGLLILGYTGLRIFKKINFNTRFTVGQKIDSLNNVFVFHNGGVDHVAGRNTTTDGYNLGLKYQCVEFVKRYYYEHLDHRMPDSYGHAKDFFDKTLTDGQKNQKRNLTQYTNPSKTRPRVDDLLVFSGTLFNRYGHVAIVAAVTDNEVEIIQQNPGPSGTSRASFRLDRKEGKWKIENTRILGWLRKE